ncbi:MAG: hypothetical protein GEV06_27275 [Luteitalea sp.]|nr:hypothetical protein [Luteitalea sp.]
MSRNRLKSVVARVDRVGGGCRIAGAAWGGPDAIERVDVQIDGQPWRSAALARRGDPHAWSLWTFEWTDATPGTHTVVSRATNSRGRIQPERSALISAREDNSQWPRKVAVAQGFRK